MLNKEFLELIHPIIKENGNLFMSTDWENYAESIGEAVNNSNGYQKLDSSIYENSELTKFQKRAVEEGRAIYTFALKVI